MSQITKILIVDDDQEIREILGVLLESEGYIIDEAGDGATALERFNDDIQLIILDIMMDGMSGYQVCQKIREISNVPILFLTAKGKESDLTLGFSYGGDDYIVKPFSYVELIARVKGLLRRYQTYQPQITTDENSEIYECDGLRVMLNRNRVWKNDMEITLTNKEYMLLKVMINNRGSVCSAQTLYETIWEEPYYATSNNTIMVHMRRLREKIEEDPDKPRILKTIWGKGYCVE